MTTYKVKMKSKLFEYPNDGFLCTWQNKNFFFDKVVVYIIITPDSLFLCNVSVASSTTSPDNNLAIFLQLS